jgi:DNA processing protein
VIPDLHSCFRMVDPRLGIFFQSLSGLELTPDDVAGVLKRGGLSARETAEGLVSEKSIEGLKARPHWYEEAKRIWARSLENGVQWSHPGSEDYPPLWRTLSTAPVAFSYIGRPVWLEHELLAVVGSRTPLTETRIWMQRELGYMLKNTPIGIVSGGARGVDQWAHRLAIDFGRPTVVVLPTGILNPYPFGHEELWRRVLEGGGCLLSTFSMDEPLRKWAFHVRNRWIAGLTRVCFVAEANRRSGSSLTAMLALEEGREVATLPVFPIGEQGLANLDLIGEGAHLIRDRGDLEQLCRSRPTLFKSTQGEEQEERVH